MPLELDTQPALMPDGREDTPETLDITRIFEWIAVIIAIIVDKGIWRVQWLYVLQTLSRRIEELDSRITEQRFEPPLLQGGERHGWLVQRSREVSFDQRPRLAFHCIRDR